MSTTPIHTCPRCQEPYYVYNMICADQSMCSSCRASLEGRIEKNRRKQDAELLPQTDPDEEIYELGRQARRDDHADAAGIGH